MFNNLINIHDFRRLIEKLRQGYFSRLTGSLLKFKASSRVQNVWQQTGSPPKHWGSIPEVRKRWNYLISGDSDSSVQCYVSNKYFTSDDLVGLSVGCGTGSNELLWAQTGKFKRIDAFDLSEARIMEAKKKADSAILGDIVQFSVADMNTVNLLDAHYDVIFAENALHHFSPLEEAILKLSATLKPRGIFVLRDFVGPSRFQWTPRQLQVVDGVLSILPERYRRRWRSGSLKSRFYPPSLLSMLISDPSEAAESSMILPLLAKNLLLKEHRPLGGTILHLLFHDIAHNFQNDNEEEKYWLQLCFEIEDTLLKSGEIDSDLAFAVYQKKDQIRD